MATENKCTEGLVPTPISRSLSNQEIDDLLKKKDVNNCSYLGKSAFQFHIVTQRFVEF